MFDNGVMLYELRYWIDCSFENIIIYDQCILYIDGYIILLYVDFVGFEIIFEQCTFKNAYTFNFISTYISTLAVNVKTLSFWRRWLFSIIYSSFCRYVISLKTLRYFYVEKRY